MMLLRLTKYLLLVVVIVIIAVVLSLSLWSRQVQPGEGFNKVPFNFAFHDWFDAGVVDINSDGKLDLYSSNHDARQSLLLGKGDGTFDDALSIMGFDQEQDFPGLEDSNLDMEFTRAGLYIYYQHGNLRIKNVSKEAMVTEFSGSISLSSQIQVKQKNNFDVEINARQISAGVYHSTLQFRVPAVGSAELVIPYKAVPMTVHLSDGVQLKNVYVGRQMTNPKRTSFLLYLRDRHGIAWSDLNNDNMLDAFISRGGLNGKINQFPDKIENELLLSNKQQRFVRQIKTRKLDKSACPARQTMWVDFDTDGDLDLYLVCGRQTGGFWEYVPKFLRKLSAADEKYPNQLFRQAVDGTFNDVAKEMRLDFPEGGSAAWLDVDQDGDMDLLWASEQGIQLYRNQLLAFEAEAIKPSSRNQVRKLALADYDSDGDLDVFAIAAIGSRLLRNTNGKFESLDPGSVDLPRHIKTGSWLDYDNDGLMDFYAWPQGIYRQTDDGKFVEQDILSVTSPWSVLMDARALWFDFDNDGDQDVLVMHRYFPHAIQQLLPDILSFNGALYENTHSLQQHWLEIELSGKAGNNEALGAKITIENDDLQQHRWVGQAESSHYSQGHYRNYFGLGNSAKKVALKVRWPDGLLQQHHFAVDQKIVLSRESHPRNE
ncbi:hypothetical protein MNBD_GAMMA06-611 [hydrothermal vent metagenome]|uniref:ASPIC/UnbV domain-containing protein n=1 Tax=hydrothermal vent metagenome TaxID=652676 RepID=A0A3B0WHJ7_9ZZZZ